MALGGKGTMSGTNWHIEKKFISNKKKSSRKSKYKCTHYENSKSNVCLKKMCDCSGVTNCKDYKKK